MGSYYAANPAPVSALSTTYGGSFPVSQHQLFPAPFPSGVAGGFPTQFPAPLASPNFPHSPVGCLPLLYYLRNSSTWPNAARDAAIHLCFSNSESATDISNFAH